MSQNNKEGKKERRREKVGITQSKGNVVSPFSPVKKAKGVSNILQNHPGSQGHRQLALDVGTKLFIFWKATPKAWGR